ncbi:autotransporter barrel domain-containing lipoprotein [Escherichia coli]|nr:autotransporter barrel domain-containing lipoprotein [Escherichia coli]
MNRIYRVIWNCTLQVFQACSELTRRAGKTSTVNLRKSSGLTTKFSRLTLGVLLALSGSASGASLEVDNDQITNIDTDVAYDAYLVGWYGTGVLNILAGGNASLTTITTSVIGANEDSEGTVNVLGGTWRLYDSGNNARPLNVGQSGTGTLNIKQKGHVDGGYLRLGSSTGGVGTVNVEGEDSVLTTELFEIGSYGTGSLNITDKGYVTSSIVAILGYQAGSNGQVVVEKGGEWLIKNNDSSIEFQIGNQGTGEATIREGGLITAENTIIGGNATGIGTLNVQDQDSVITVRRLYNGYFGNGTLNISNNGLINNKEYSLVGVQDGSHGVVNVTDKGHWNFLGTGEAFRYIYIGDAGDGELNVSREGKVDSGIITAGMKETGTGNITVKDKNSVITNLGTNLGYDGHGEMNISNEGLVVSNGGSSLGYGETGVGNVSITTGGMWEVNKNVYTTIGVAGVGNLNISDGGKFVSQNITFLGDKASGIGTLNLMDATSSFDTVGINVGNFGSGIVNVSNGATLNSTGYGFIGGNASGKGIVNISTDSLWNLKTSSTNAQLLQVGVLGKGELNITTGGIVKARDTQIALNDKSKGDVRVDGQNSLLETFNMYVGTSGTGTLTLTNSGTLNVEGGEVYLGVFEPAVGTLNIGAAHGEAAADAGYITNATKVEFGSGEGVFVFNHTHNSDAGYQVDMLITGDDKDGKVIHDAGHTVFNAGNTYSGKTLVNDGLLTIASHTADGVTGMGSSEVTIASPGTLDILASTNSAGDYTLTNALKGDGLMRVQLSSYDKMFGFTHATGTEFAGVAQLKDSTFTLERDNTAALTHAMLQSDSENTTSVKVGEQSIGGLAMNGGTLIFDTDIPAATLAEGYISVDTLVVGAGDYTWKGRNYQVNGTGDVLIDVPKPWNDPMANNPLTTLNLLEHDDSHVGVQLVKAQTVIGSGGSLTLRDLQGDEVEADKTLHIAQNGTVVAEGDYGFRLTTAPGDGLYVNYGLKALNIHGGQKLTLAEHGGAYGATADMSAKIGGEGDLAINTVRQVSLSNGQNDYQGATYVQMGTLRTDADGALGNTRELNISNAAIVDLNGSTQTVETFTGQMGSTVLFKEGALTVNKGGISQGELTGGGNLNVTGGTLAIEGLNARYNALTSISPNAEVSLDNTQGLGRGNIANDGLLTLKNVTGELRNSISGKGIVSATARTDVELDGDNSRFVGQFNIDTGSALSVNEQKNLGDASVINNGLLTISTERSWAMTHSISGSGDVTKLGTGILTLNNDSAAYQGTTDIVGGEIAFGSDSAINMASQHINIHNSGVMSGNVTTAGDVNVMPGGTLRVAKTTIGGNLENGGTVQMNSEGGKPGNVLTVNGNYTGNNGLMTFNATLGGDNSPTDKMNVKGDTQGNTRVRVDNIGGVGAQTVNGIELIEVGGNSAGNFALTTGTVEAGAYVYTLAKGKGNDEKNWYLTSKWDGVTPPDTPDPINNPPVVDPEGPSVYRPEAGSYISNIAAANSLFSHRLHDRLGEPQYIDSLHSQGSASSMWMRHVGGHERSRAGDGQLEWLASRYARPLSLSLPLQRGNITSDAVFNFFDNLLPDSPIVRDRIVKRYHAKSRQPFDLLSEIGRDSVGAVTLLPENETITRPIMAWEKLTEARLEEVLTAYKADIPLGMIREENDFRISVAGAQEKTALLRIGNDWCIPKGITPTTHIIKLPIGEIRQPNATLDLSQSVDNEYYCLLLAKELGLNVPDAEIIKAGRVRALAVERFDRRWNTERTVLLRLPQEDMCQTFGLPSSVKYESDGGPGIARIMAFLMGSSEALRDRYDFMKFQVFQWLIGATDGHAKNFSVFIQAGGSYRLTPFYDIISAFPVLGGTGIHISDLKLAMGLNASKGKKTAIDKIYPRHFLATAKVLRFPEVQMHEILSDFARMIPAALDNVKTSLPTDFPENVVTAVETNVLRLHGRLSREYGSK